MRFNMRSKTPTDFQSQCNRSKYVMIEMELWKEHKSKEYRTITKIRASLEAWLCDLIVLGIADGKRIKCNFNGEWVSSITVFKTKEA